MRIYQRILLVAVLTVVFIAAGVAWVRCYLAPVVEEAAHKPEQADESSGGLPTACLDELAALENPSANHVAGEPMIAGDSPKFNHGSQSYPNSAAGDQEQRPNGAGMLGAAPARSPTGSDAEVRPIAAAQSAEWNTSAAQRPAQAPPPRLARAATLPVSVEEAVPSEALDSLKTVDVLDLMRRLRSDTESERASARRELVRRGFSEVDLELARQLFSPDVEARKQLARAVPRLASVDAARWLMWLAADPQPEVRMAAISTLATTGDPALLDRVEALARKDSDQQIQAMADQIAKQRDLTTARGGNPLR